MKRDGMIKQVYGVYGSTAPRAMHLTAHSAFATVSPITSLKNRVEVKEPWR